MTGLRLAASMAAVLLTAGAEPRQITQSGAGAYEASLAPVQGGFAVAWYDTRDGHPEIYLRLLDDRGQPSSPERRLTDGADAAYEPDIAAVGGDLFVAWYEKSMAGEYRARLGSWTIDGRPRWTVTLSDGSNRARNPVVRVTGTKVFCAWIDADDLGAPEVRARWFDVEGTPIGTTQRVAAAGRTTWNLNADIDRDGRAWLVFDAKAGTRQNELFLARVDTGASQIARLTGDDGHASKYPDVAIGDGRVALTWFDERDGNEEVYLFVGESSELREGMERRARRITRTPGASIGAYVAWNGNRFGLSWCDNSPGQHEVYFESFTAGGDPATPVRRLTFNRTESLIPAIRPVRGGFAMVWNEFTPGAHGAHDSRGRSDLAFALVR